MEINNIISQQLSSLQQTLSMTVLNKAMNQGAGMVEMLQEMPQQQAAPHPYKGQYIDVQA
ncbi:MAG: YjfB family protein [Lysinibacillus sp.]